MANRTFTLFSLLAMFLAVPYAQAQNKADRKVAKQLQADISYLASEELEGRRTSSEGERKAADYLEKRYKEEGISPYKGQYRYPFHFVYGKEISKATQVRIGTLPMRIQEDVFPLPFSASKHAYSEVMAEVMEQGNIWLLPLYADADEANNPHFDWEKYMYEHAKEAAKNGASGVIFYDGFGGKWEPTFNAHSEYELLDIPVVYMMHGAYDKYIRQNDNNTSVTGSQKGGIPIDLNIAINKSERTGNNLAAYIDNGAPLTVIVGAHYDHLGYGEDGNSMMPNAKKMHKIHYGADDNASGTAAILEIAQWVKSKKLRNYNYLFINFSGEELGLYGSKAFVKDQKIDSAHIAYMINLDMLGRLNDSTHALTLGGIGTSPEWADVVEMGGKDFKIVRDSSGIGPSDHTSFYNVGIPVLFFFTGLHQDYHKPTDKADLINYNGETMVINYVHKVIAKIDKEDKKPAFTATKVSAVGRVNFKVTLGIMPDYTFETGEGLRIDGITDNRAASKAGLKAGDIITKLGDNKVMGIQTYMEALSKFVPGDKTQVTFLRDGKLMILPIDLSK